MIRGTATVNGRTVPISDTYLRGDEIEFTVDLADARPSIFRGKIAGDSMTPRADATAAAASGWSATRTMSAPDVVLKRRG